MKPKFSKILGQRSKLFDLFISLSIAGIIIVNYNSKKDNTHTEFQSMNAIKTAENRLFGFNQDSFSIQENVIQKNDFFGAILQAYNLPTNLILLIEHEAKDIFNLKNIQAGKKYHVIKRNECDETPLAIVYEPDNYKYVVYDFRDSVNVRLVEKEVHTKVESAYGKIEGSLWSSLDEQGVDASIIDLMEDALSSSVDFYHARKDDEYKIIFERKYVDGKAVGIGKLLAAQYTNDGGTNYSILYEGNGQSGYFDTEGRPAKKSFLKSPVKYSKISSGFSMRRFHPIKRVNIPHYGTDYAAPYGTEIRAVADGTVNAAAYTSGNGKYVKIKHDNTYETQYLHMSRFAKGIRPGQHVKQGQTIGYVGATGLATGPHVCFRFWKNGRQVNHLKEKLPSPVPMNMTELPKYFQHRDEMITKLNGVGVKEVVSVYQRP